MRFALHTILLLVSSAAVGCLAAAAGAVWWNSAKAWFSIVQPWLVFGCAFGAYLLAYAAGLRRVRLFTFLSTLDHESIHAISGALTFAGVERVTVCASGEGLTTLVRNNFLTALAPYIVSHPLLLVVAMHAMFPIRPEALQVMLGIAFGYHVVRVGLDTIRHRKVDFEVATMPAPLAVFWIAAGLLFFSGLVAALVAGRWSGAMTYLCDIGEQFEVGGRWLASWVGLGRGA